MKLLRPLLYSIIVLLLVAEAYLEGNEDGYIMGYKVGLLDVKLHIVDINKVIIK